MKTKKQGFKLPTRLIIVGLMIICEVLLVMWTINSLSSHALWAYTAAEFISIITVITIVTKRGDPGYKMMWIIFILLVPLFGVASYLLWGGGRMLPYFKNRMKKCANEYMAFLPSDTDESLNLQYNDMLHFRQAEYLRKGSGYPIYNATQSQYFAPGEKFFPILLEELQKAQKYIFIEYFILAEGEMWDAIFAVLKEKAKSGVEIKIIFDDFGSMGRQSKKFIRNIKESGIEVASFNPILPIINIFMNNRNHRKIVVIDGNTAFTGGLNIADEYINKLERFGYWMDCAIMIKGRAVDAFLNMFCSMWKFSTGKKIDYKSHRGDLITKNDGFYIPYCDDPLNDSNHAKGIYMQILNNAQKYVYITSPYLILDNSMLHAITLAAKSGIDVKIVTPSIPDKWYVHCVTQYYYSELLDSGVKIYEYKPGFIHSKLFISDDSVATVGTVNMDYRSFYLHFECGVWMSGTESLKEIKKNFEDILANSDEINLEKWKKRSVFLKIKQVLLHLLSPLM